MLKISTVLLAGMVLLPMATDAAQASGGCGPGRHRGVFNECWLNLPSYRPVYRPIVRPIYSPIYHPVVRPVFRPIYRPVIRPIYRPIYRPVVRPIYRPVIRPVVIRFFHPRYVRHPTGYNPFYRYHRY